MKYSYKNKRPLKYAIVFGLNNSKMHVSLYAMTRSFSMAKRIVALLHEQHPPREVWILKVDDYNTLRLYGDIVD